MAQCMKLENKNYEQRDFYVGNDSNELIITIGDSWTWGDSLGDCSVPYRSKHVYGRYLADDRHMNWVNWGWCGCSNWDIVSTLTQCIHVIDPTHKIFVSEHSYNNMRDPSWPTYQEYIQQDHTKHDQEIAERFEYQQGITHLDVLQNRSQVKFIVTLTETGRDISQFDASQSIDQTLRDHEQHIHRVLQYYQQDFDIVVGRNFTYDYMPSTAIEKNWCMINYENNMDNYGYQTEDLQVTGPVTSACLEQSSMRQHPAYKQYFVEQTTVTDGLRDWLIKNPLNNVEASKHPTERSHRLWAEYLLTHF